MNQENIAKITPRIEPLLYFDRQCEEAIELYVKAFDAKLTFLMRFSDIPEKDWPPKFDASKDLQLIASFVVMFNNNDEIKVVYDVLAEGATILNPSDDEGIGGPIVDKYGIHWDLIVYHD